MNDRSMEDARRPLPAPLLGALLLFGCATPGGPPPPPGAAAAPPLALPPHVVATRSTVLRLPGDQRVRLAFPRVGLPLRVREAHGQEALVELDGAIRVAGVARLDELGVVVCAPGPVGEHFYAGNGNELQLRSGVREGRVRVAGSVLLRVKAYAEDTPFQAQFRSVPFEAEVDVARLCAAPLPKRHAGTHEDPSIGHAWDEPDEEDFPPGTAVVEIEKGAPLELLDAPGGKPLHTFPATQWGFVLVLLRREGGWAQVAAGGGPYLTGWIPAREPRKEKPTGGLVFGKLGGASTHGPAALHAKKLASLPLHALPAGTELQQFGVSSARLGAPGYGRVVGPPNGQWSYVIAAVDEDVTVEGWVQTAQLGERVE